MTSAFTVLCSVKMSYLHVEGHRFKFLMLSEHLASSPSHTSTMDLEIKQNVITDIQL